VRNLKQVISTIRVDRRQWAYRIWRGSLDGFGRWTSEEEITVSECFIRKIIRKSHFYIHSHSYFIFALKL